MLSLAYWNLNGNDVADHVVELAAALAVGTAPEGPDDVMLCLAEHSSIDASALAVRLGHPWRALTGTGTRCAIITTLPEIQFTAPANKESGCYVRLQRPSAGAPRSINVCFVHLRSPFAKWHPDETKLQVAEELRRDVEAFEAEGSVEDSVVLGDFNMDPYDPSMIRAFGLNAAMCRTVAAARSRRHGRKGFEKETRYFYNPMFRCLGDRTQTNQPGSFFHKGDVEDALFWHCLDQVVVRPDLIDDIADGSPRILVEAGMLPLLTAAGAINDTITDHLPLQLRLRV